LHPSSVLQRGVSRQRESGKTGDTTVDWNLAAQKCGNAILSVNPDVLIVIEGVEQVGSKTYWWGGNLEGVVKTPIVLTKPEKLVYSPHEYGPEVFQQPWFDSSSFPSNLSKV
jgi:endoglucanase